MGTRTSGLCTRVRGCGKPDVVSRSLTERRTDLVLAFDRLHYSSLLICVYFEVWLLDGLYSTSRVQMPVS